MIPQHEMLKQFVVGENRIENIDIKQLENQFNLFEIRS